jgi:hypothetical protein
MPNRLNNQSKKQCFLIGMKLCDKCGYRHGHGRCCIDIYQQLGQAKGPSVAGKALLAFVLPLLLFIGSLILAEYILSAFMAEGASRTFVAFLAALVVTIIFVQLVRIFTQKPINTENKQENMNGFLKADLK